METSAGSEITANKGKGDSIRFYLKQIESRRKKCSAF